MSPVSFWVSFANGAAHLAYSRSISTWFQRRLGIDLAFVMVGAGSHDSAAYIAQAIISRSGWRTSYASLGGLALLLGLPLSWRYIHECGESELNEAFRVADSGKTWQQGLGSLTFWTITAILFASSISMNGAIAHLSALLTDWALRRERQPHELNDILKWELHPLGSEV